MKRVVVIYDVGDDRRRLRLARSLQARGLARVQRSAFTGVMRPGDARELERLARAVVDLERDVVHIIPVSPADWKNVIIVGVEWGRAHVKGATII